MKFLLLATAAAPPPAAARLPRALVVRAALPLARLQQPGLGAPLEDGRDGQLPEPWPGLRRDGGRHFCHEFCARFRGRVTAPKSGTYQFSLSSDDGSKLFVDNALIINNDGLHGAPVLLGAEGGRVGGAGPRVRGAVLRAPRRQERRAPLEAAGLGLGAAQGRGDLAAAVAAAAQPAAAAADHAVRVQSLVGGAARPRPAAATPSSGSTTSRSARRMAAGSTSSSSTRRPSPSSRRAASTRTAGGGRQRRSTSSSPRRPRSARTSPSSSR